MIKLKDNTAVTLIEMVMVIVMVAVVAAGVSLFIVRAIDTWNFVSFRSELVAQGRLAIEKMVREIVQLKDDQSVLTATATNFQFNDVDDNNVQYQLSGTTLLRNSDSLADGVQSLQFTYYDLDGNELSTPLVSPNATDLWRIVIEMTVQSGDQSATLRSQAHPRNLFR